MIRDISQTEPSRQCIPIGPDNPMKSINILVNQDDSSFKDPSLHNYDQIFPNVNNPQLLSPTNNSKIKDKDNEFLINRSYVISFSPKILESNKLIQPISDQKSYTLNPLISKFNHIFESYEQQSELDPQLLLLYQIFGLLISILLLIYPTLSITLDIFNATIPFIGIKSLEIILNLHLIKQIGKLFLILDVVYIQISYFLAFLFYAYSFNNIYPLSTYLHIFPTCYQSPQISIILYSYLVIILFLPITTLSIYTHTQINSNTSQSYLFLLYLVIYLTYISVNQNPDYDYHSSPYINIMLLVLNILSSNSSFVPQDQLETIYLIFMILFSIYLHFYVLLQLVNIYRIDDRQIQLKQYLIQNNQLNHHLKKFLENQFHKPDLTDIIKNHSMLSTINRSQIYNILKKYFHRYNNETLREVVYSCDYLEIAPDDIIIKQNDDQDKSIYFILEGQFAIYTSYGQQMGLTDPQFGEYSFYTDQQRQASIVSLSYGRLLKLDRQDFLKKLCESDKQHFHQIKDKIVYESIYPYKCLCCKTNSHSILKCPVLTYQPKISDLNLNKKNNQIYRIQYNRQKKQKSKSAFQACKSFLNKQQINYSESSSSLSSYDFNQLPYDEEYNNSQISNFDSPVKQQTQEQQYNYQQQYQQQQQQLWQQQQQDKKIQSQSLNLQKFQISPIKSSTLENINVQRDQSRKKSNNKPSILNVINEQVEDQYQSESESSSNQSNEDLEKFSLNPHQDQMGPRRVISEYVEQSKQLQSQSQSQQFTSYDHLENIDIYNQDFEIVEDFDKMQNYKIYNPHNNYYNSIQISNSLMESYNKIQMNTKKQVEPVESQSPKID